MRDELGMSIYDRLGVSTIINGAGATTRLSGSLMPKAVVEAMTEASRHLVDIECLQAKASEIISRVTGAEAGFVTSGAAAGLVLATAACITGLDIAKMERLPDTSGMKNEVVIPRHQRNAYDHQIRLAGAKLVEAGLDECGVGVGARSVEGWEIESAIGEKTAAIAYLAKPRSTPSLDEITKIAEAHGIPVIVDAAGELPPVTNLKNFVARGASLVVFSGGKAIRGPQSTGILCGRNELIMAALLQQLDMSCRSETWNPPSNLIDKSKLKGMPRHGIGRGYKVSKEEIVGLITALELYCHSDQAEEMKRLETMAKYIVEALGNVDGIIATFLPKTDTRPMPLAELKFLGHNEPNFITRLENYLRSQSPPIYLDDKRFDEMILQVNPFNLQDNELDIIVRRIKEALTHS